jgi:hypothetical protein
MVEKKDPLMAYAMSLTSLENFAFDAEESISVYGGLLKEYLCRAVPPSSALISLMCQGYSSSTQLLDIASSNLIDPVYLKKDSEKVMILEEDMYMIETLALSRIYCDSQLKRFSISVKMN